MPLADLRSHEQQLLAGMGQQVRIKAPGAAELVFVVSGHFPHHTALHVDHLVMGDGKDIVLGKRVHHGEGQIPVVVLPEPGVQLQIVAHVIHPAHVPLQIESKSADVGRLGHQRPGGRFLSDHQHVGIHLKGHGIQLPEKFHCFQVFPSAVDIGSPLAVLPPVIQIQHGGHGVHPDTIDVVHFQPEPGRGEEEAHHLRPPVVKDPGTPAGVFPFPGIGIFITAGTVKLVKALLILAEVRGDPVQNHRNVVFVKVVYKPHEILRRTESGGRRKVSGALVTPGIIQRMLRHRQQLHGGVAHLLHISRQLPGHIPVIQELAVFMLPPRAQVHLVDVQRLVVHRLLIAAEVLIRPGKMLNVIELAGGAGAGLRMEPVGVRLVVNSAILAGNGILIAGIDGQVRKKALPELALLGKWINGQVPAVKISDHGNSLCMRRPNVEPPAVDVSLCGRMRTEEPPAVRQAAAVVQLCLICHGSPLSAAILFFLILRVAF